MDYYIKYCVFKFDYIFILYNFFFLKKHEIEHSIIKREIKVKVIVIIIEFIKVHH